MGRYGKDYRNYFNPKVKTQIKTFIIENPLQIEPEINKWLSEQGDIEVYQIYPLVILDSEQKPHIMFILTFKKEGWK